MDLAFQDLRTAAAVIIGMDGATNVLLSSMSNIISHTPRPWFIEYLRVDLKKELTDELLIPLGLSAGRERVHIRFVQHDALSASQTC